jgi:DNA repair exonuclease SbcCD nuclease subunit
MTVEGVRFLHAGELNLGSPLFGIGGLPYQLRSIVADARYRAVERLCSAAIRSNVDFVLLAGGVVSESAGGPRPYWFLAEQFERLARHGIPVYWFETAAAKIRWSQYVPLPANLLFGDMQSMPTFEFRRNSQPLAQITAGASSGDALDSDLPRIAALPEGLDGLPLSPVGVDYWALGGGGGGMVVTGDAPSLCGVAHFPGSTQGHSPSEAGPHGGVLVTIDRQRRCSTEFIGTDSVRWHNEHVRVVGEIDWAYLRRELSHRQERLIAQAECDLLVIRWKLSGQGPLWQQLRRDDVCRQLQSKLVKEGRDRRPAAWSLSIDLNPDPEQLAAWESEESLFGEATRRLRRTAPTPAPHFVREPGVRAPRPVAKAVGN